jgi:hypothetical protein
MGYTLVYGVLRLINFAHSEVFMIGTFAALGALTLFGIDSPQSGLALVGVLLLMTLVAWPLPAARPSCWNAWPTGRCASAAPPAGRADLGHRRLVLPAGGLRDLAGPRPAEHPPGDEQGRLVQHRVGSGDATTRCWSSSRRS